MRKLTIVVSVAAAAMTVSACNTPAETPKEETMEVDAGDTPTTEVDVNSTAVTNSATSEANTNSGENTSAMEDDKGGDPGIKKSGE